MQSYIPNHIRIEKRAFDILVASLLLLMTLPLIPIIALIIKLESKGSVFYSQERVGEILPDQVKLFRMFKFRTMASNAENDGPQLAKENDARITRVGRILRKTRIDEIPQLINVIKGDMSLIGPRPERPFFYNRNEKSIPFFSERTYGLKPGITGMAQVSQGYDTCIEDVKSKVAFDHSYALTLTSTLSWLYTDAMILVQTIMVVIMGRGQ